MRALRICLLAAATVGMAACGGGGEAAEPVEATETVERTVAMDSSMAFHLDGFNGQVIVEGRRDSVATITMEKKATAESAEAAEALLESITITADSSGGAYALRLRSEAPERTSVEVRVQVPYRTPLRLELENGPVEVQAVSAPITVSVDNGSVEIEGATGALSVTAVNGNVTARMAGFREGAEVTLETTNGNVDLGVPASASAQVEAATEVGELTVRGVTLAERVDDTQTTGGTVRGVLGSGEGRITLRAQNGSVALRGTQ